MPLQEPQVPALRAPRLRPKDPRRRLRVRRATSAPRSGMRSRTGANSSKAFRSPGARRSGRSPSPSATRRSADTRARCASPRWRCAIRRFTARPRCRTWKRSQSPAASSGHLVEDVVRHERPQRRRRGTVARIGADPLLFPRDAPRDPGVRRPKAELAVEPEGARVDRLGVLEAELVGVDRERRHAERVTVELHDLRVDPRRLPLPKRVVHVEADLEPLEEGEPFDVADRHAVLHDEAAVGRPQRQAPLGPDAEQEELDAPSGARREDRGGVGEGERVELPIPRRRGFADQVAESLALAAREPAHRKRRLREDRVEGNVAARQQRPFVEEQRPRRQAHPGARGARVAEVPFHRERRARPSAPPSPRSENGSRS